MSIKDAARNFNVSSTFAERVLKRNNYKIKLWQTRQFCQIMLNKYYADDDGRRYVYNKRCIQ